MDRRLETLIRPEHPDRPSRRLKTSFEYRQGCPWGKTPTSSECSALWGSGVRGSHETLEVLNTVVGGVVCGCGRVLRGVRGRVDDESGVGSEPVSNSHTRQPFRDRRVGRDRNVTCPTSCVGEVGEGRCVSRRVAGNSSPVG